ncbi:MAG: hypothetical protein KDA28_10215 [Phycisphaerales bacterium]|nr:hypothetical protein [Phycisphaerales bacterium]
MRAIVETILGLLALAGMGLRSRFRLKGAYWTWRLHTAFGHERPERGVMLHSVLSYARWVHRMRRMAR